MSRTAPVNAPFTWPNISDSSRGSGRAAQFSATRPRLQRRLWWWMNWAKSSLPVPLSPVRKTDASVAATLRANSMAFRNTGETPRTVTFSLLPCWRSSSVCSCLVSRATLSVCAARPSRICKWVAENGLGR